MTRSGLLVLAGGLLALTGCVTIDSKLDAKGGGTMTISYAMKESELATVRKQIEGPHVKVESAEFKDGRGIFKATVDDAEKINTSKFFEHATVTLADAKDGTRDLTLKIGNAKPFKPKPEVVEKLGKNFRLTIELPGEVVRSNGSTTQEAQVTWLIPTEEFLSKSENILTASFKAGKKPA